MTLPYLFADMPCHGNTIFDSYAFYWDEGYDIGGAQPGMCALVSIEINQFGGFANAANGSFLDRLPFADERDDATVMVGIHLAVEKIHAIEFHGLNDGINF